ncbi:N-acetylmannosamine kinase [Clostridia bacterium]|nr:N-acetylmannosamine kinase [Clostridia bacterium]
MFLRLLSYGMMQNFEDQLAQVYPSLSKSERRVADFVRDNLTAVLRMSLRELKQAVNASEPTILRFCKGMGFSGYKDFKISCAQQVATYRNVLDLDDNAQTPLQSRVKRMLTTQVKIINDTLRFLDYAQLEDTAHRIQAANRIVLFGVGTSSEICLDACRKLTRLGLRVWAYSDLHDAITQISTLNGDDLVIGISHSGITKETGDALKVAQRGGVFTMLITSFPNAPISQYAQLVLRTFAHEPVNNRVSIVSRVGQFALMDALYVALYAQLGENIVPMMEQTTKDILQR